jgi:hypothetical protein
MELEDFAINVRVFGVTGQSGLIKGSQYFARI